MVVPRFTRFLMNLGNLHILQDICYVRMTDGFLTIYGHCASLLNINNNTGYWLCMDDG